MRNRSALTILVMICLVATAWTAEPIPLVVAHGKVEKVEKDTLTFQPRDDSGKFGKAITLQLTGTSKLTTLSTQLRDKKLVLTQKEGEAKDLSAGQVIAVIYATPKGQEPVLLSAIVEPSEK
jgi:hypothetical protein